MLRLLADENLNRTTVSGLLERLPQADFPRVQDLGLAETSDVVLLGWAAEHNRIVVSNDVTTMTKYAADRIRAGLRMPGLLLIPSTTSVTVAIDELMTICCCSEHQEWDGLIAFLPL